MRTFSFFAFCLLALVAGRCGRAPASLPVLVLEDQSLVLHGEDGPTVLFRAVKPAEASRAADVRRAHSLVHGPRGNRAAVIVSLNRQNYFVPLRLTEGDGVRFGSAVKIPAGVEMRFSPDGEAVLLVSRRDLYLPPESTFRLNRGAMLLGPVRAHPYATVAEALDAEPEGPSWYRDPTRRFVAEADFEVEDVRWTEAGCSLAIRGPGGMLRVVDLP